MKGVTEVSKTERQGKLQWKARFVRALSKRCPRCGEGALFRSRFRLAERCETCGLVYRREQGAMTGQMYLSAAVTELFAGLMVLLVFALTDWDTALSIAILVPLVVGFSYWFLPHAMAAWVAIEYLTDLSNEEEWVREDRIDG